MISKVKNIYAGQYPKIVKGPWPFKEKCHQRNYISASQSCRDKEGRKQGAQGQESCKTETLGQLKVSCR